MTPEDENDLQIISTKKTWQRLLVAFFGVPCFLVGIASFMAAVSVTPPPVGDSIYAILWILILSVVPLALLRNIILKFIFKRTLHSNFLSLVYFGKIVNYLVGVSIISFFIAGVLSVNVTLTGSSIGLLFTWCPIYLIFSEPITNTGETRLLFELLDANLDNFEKRQPYLIKISKKVESQLKIGNIKVPRYEFVYYFNMKLLKGIDIQDDLKNIESWIVDKKTPCFESLKKIYPENKLEPYKRVPLSSQLVENPTALKYTFAIVFLIVLVVVSPDLRNEIIGLLTRLVGI